MSNRLPILAAEINRAHDLACRAAQTTLDHAIAVGERLNEAKAILGHGKWLPWLAENCDFSERMARNYMRLAKHKDEVKSKSATVADLTVRAALDSLAASETLDNDHIFPPVGVVRIWPAAPLNYFLVEHSTQHPGYFHSGFADLTEGGAFVIADKQPIRADFLPQTIEAWSHVTVDTLRNCSFFDVPKGDIPELESELIPTVKAYTLSLPPEVSTH